MDSNPKTIFGDTQEFLASVLRSEAVAAEATKNLTAAKWNIIERLFLLEIATL